MMTERIDRTMRGNDFLKIMEQNFKINENSGFVPTMINVASFNETLQPLGPKFIKFEPVWSHRLPEKRSDGKLLWSGASAKITWCGHGWTDCSQVLAELNRWANALPKSEDLDCVLPIEVTVYGSLYEKEPYVETFYVGPQRVHERTKIDFPELEHEQPDSDFGMER